MSLTTRDYIDLKDILSFRFECTNCHTEVSYNPIGLGRFPSQCPVCDAVWVENNAESPTRVISSMIGHFEKAKKALSECKNFELMLEISRSSSG